MNGPCTPYLTVEELRDDPGLCIPDPEPDDYDEVLQAFIDRASEIMFALTGRQFPGDCTVVRWPMRRYGCPQPFMLPFAMLETGFRPADDAITLWYQPRDITVHIDGDVFTDWWLRNGTDLVRADGSLWPTVNHPELPDDSEGTFWIEWTFGPDTPGIVKNAAQQLAVQFQLESVQDARCKLPVDTTSVSRQGQTITIDRDIERVREAGPNLQAIMVATAAYNPHNARTPSDAWSPDHLWELVSVGTGVPAGS